MIDPPADRDTSKAHIAEIAADLFGKADYEDLTSQATLGTAQRFLKATYLYDVLQYFGPLDEESKQKVKYAKWKAAQISRGLREGVKPSPGGPKEDSEAIARKLEEYKRLVNEKEAEQAAMLAELEEPSQPHPGYDHSVGPRCVPYVDRSWIVRVLGRCSKGDCRQQKFAAGGGPRSYLETFSLMPNPDRPEHTLLFSVNRQ